MKVIQTINSIDKSDGGPSFYLQLLAKELGQSLDVTLATQKSPSPVEFSEYVKGYFGEIQGFGPFRYSKDLNNFFKSCEADILHGHGLWQYPVHAMCRAAKKRNIPYIVSTHGMLEAWSMSQGRLKKQIALQLFQKYDLNNAQVIHATAEMEAENLRTLGFKQPIAVIPNGIDLSEIQESAKNTDPSNDKRQLLFLSRVHPKKGLDLLINAWSKLDGTIRQNWEVNIAGNGELEYVNTLQQLIISLDLQEEIKIIGPVYDDEKKRLFTSADLFILPTHSENFGIVIAEALAYQTPVITTKMAPWKDLEKYQCGWWTNDNESAILQTLSKALPMNDDELKKMGKYGRNLIESKYDISTVAKKMTLLYEWIVGKTNKPDFVII